MRLRVVLPILALIVVMSFAVALVRFLILWGAFRNLEYHQPGPCTPVLGVESSEDMALDPESGLLYISSEPRRALPGEELPDGSILVYDLNTRPLQPSQATPDLDFPFHPHGIGLFRRDSEARLFVVNHRGAHDSVEIFRVSGDQLQHLESISEEPLYNANDVHSVGERGFYVTRDHGSRREFWRSFERSLGFQWSDVLFFDGAGFRIAAEGLAYANGISADPSGERVYVAATLDRGIHVFRRDLQTNDLFRLDFWDLGSGVDNLDMDEAGMIWSGAHPKLLDFLEYARNPGQLSPSQVFRVTPPEEVGLLPQVEEIYLADGRYLSGSSVAVAWRDLLVIGSVFDRRFLICRLDGS